MLSTRLRRIRSHSEALIADLEPEDLCLQGMADASPAKWHLGHTTWFFEAFLLRSIESYSAADERWSYLFNSYYEAVGDRHPRPQRGLLTRPAIKEVLRWRQQVTEALEHHLDQLPTALVELGLQHEQQHQELLLMDLLDGFSRNSLEPVAYPEPTSAVQPEATYRNQSRPTQSRPTQSNWLTFPGGLVELGRSPDSGFHFDNEAPRHRVWLEPFCIAERLVTNGEYAEFMGDGGYQRADLWMSEGWALVQQRRWRSPRYWREEDEFTLAGRQLRDPQAPVRHLSWFEADAYARWADARLPDEAEWELAAASGALPQAFGCLWQWTGSPYRPYPGFRAAEGAIGEYNGKFMSSQFVLRGSCFLTPEGHERLTYRNFYPPHSRWMASGLRLAKAARP
ncbi:ergothioneine biosynthesis protein EgtB [Vulcanococcus sp.]|jgi:ergothioneine biosynthesis protein EgtB|uniref:ergothioneine biosynthesis protein EgtB n=1 Tax=Vulcanococcus sp. TaxID=2856995 RepID=UPI0032322FF0